MKLKCQLYNPNFVGERGREKRKKNHGNVILLGSIK